MFKLFSSKLIKKYIKLLVILGLFSSTVMADFLTMPDLEQLRDAEEKTLLKDLDIPGVKERSPDPTAGPRLAVSEFRIQGLVEFPELGITRKALADLMEGVRFELMGEGKLLESGYTIEELGELSDLLVEIEEETLDRHVTPLEVQQLVWLIRAQRGKRGVTLGQIETAANDITRFYRERGFILAKAYIPKQQVRDGVVNLTLLLGMLGEVSVNGNKMYAAETLKTVFDDLLLQPVTSEAIEESLFIINDFPGVNVDGYFEPGTQVGDTRLNINVKQENWYKANVRADNHGNEDSGLYRLFVDGQFNNLMGFADFLHISALQAISPENTTFGSVNYESNFFSPRIRVGIEASQNQFLIDQSRGTSSNDTNITGIVDVYGIHGRYIAERGRKNNSNYELRYEKISSNIELADSPYTDETLTHISLSYQFDILDDENQSLHEGSIKYTNGRFDEGITVGQNETYDIFQANYTFLSFVKVPFTDSNSRLIARGGLQYAGLNLPPIAKFALAGPTRVRGFSPSTFTADDAFHIGADWIFNSPDFLDINLGSVNVKNLIKPLLFADYGYAQLIKLADDNEDTTVQLANLGVGLQFSYGNSFSGNLQIAVPVQDEFSLEIAPESDSMRILFDFQYSF